MPEPANTALDDARKRARRRLVGAIVLALVAAVVVPIFLESDPKPLGPDVQIQIPAVDDSKFQNRLTPAKGGTPDKSPSEAPKPPPASGVEPGKEAAAAPSSAPRPESASPPVDSPASATPATSPNRDAAPPATAIAPPVPPTEAKGASGKVDTSAEAAKSGKDGKQAAKSADKGSDKVAEKATKTAQKPAEKTAEKPVAATKASDSAREKAIAPKASEAPHTLGTATLNPAPPAAPAKGGDFVVQVGAFVDKAVATELATKAGEQGYPVFLEPVTTKSGTVQRVRVGPFATREAADAAAAKLAAAGFTAVARPR
jgi:DedD protein